MALKDLLTEINEDDTICIALLVNFEISKDIMSIKKYRHLFFKKRFVEKWNLLTQ